MIFEERLQREIDKQEALISKPNRENDEFYNGVVTRYTNPVLTRDHVPLSWRYDLSKETNPLLIERLGINAVFNAGAIFHHGKYCLVARVEGNDRKSFFALAESDSPVDRFRFVAPLEIPLRGDETNFYDMRLTEHEDGWIYGIFCAESKDRSSSDLSAALASAAIVRTSDLITWERLDNLKTASPQQRNVCLLPSFVDGKYAFYTRPMDSFIEAGSQGGIGFGLSSSICNAEIEEEIIVSPRHYHRITEAKNGSGAVPIRTEKGWLHIAHGVRNTAAGLRYVLYLFVTDLDEPWRVIAEPGGLFLGPREGERVGDVGNVVFSNGSIALPDGRVYIYYASSDTRLHVASSTIERLLDYAFSNPPDSENSYEAAMQRIRLIEHNATER